jgi:cytochrome c-type biogenesis protein
MNTKIKTILTIIIVAIIGLIALGLFTFWFGGASAPVGAGWYLFSFATGITMIVMPCTLPLAFVIVPLSMGKGPAKGLGIALFFGLGVATMLSLYGIIAALVGKGAIEGMGANLETVKNGMYLFAGLFAFVFALGEIGLIKWRMPTYTGAAPGFIQKRGDFFKAFLLGLFLGNVGVGCPHPATPLILTRIATSGDVFYGWMLFLIHAIGRVLPLLLLATLGILGVNALQWLVARKDKIERATGWGMVFVAAYILTLGLFSHDWWVNSGQHVLFESLTQESALTGALAEKIGSGAAHNHGLETGTGMFGLPLSWGNWFLTILWVLPLWWYYSKRKKEVAALPEAEEKHIAQIDLRDKKWLFATLTLLFIIVITYTLPQRFYHIAMQNDASHAMTGAVPLAGSGPNGGPMMAGHEGHGAGTASHNAADVTSGLVVNLTVSTQKTEVGKPVTLRFEAVTKPGDFPATNLEVEHEKLIHVIGVRDDLKEFFHIHPQSLSGKQGAFAVTHTFTKPGKYKIWSEVKQGGVNHSFASQDIIVSGPGDTEDKTVTFGRNVIVDKYQVRFNVEEPVKAARSTKISFEVHDAQGNEVPLDKYLAADMHLNVISEDLSEFIHTHPGAAGGAGDGHTDHSHSMLPDAEFLSFAKEKLGEVISPVVVFADEGAGHSHGPVDTSHGVPFDVTFPKPGLYRVYAQFTPQGAGLGQDQALVAAFYIQVVEYKGFEFTGTTGKIVLTLISLVLMYLLSLKIKKYLTV